MTGLVDYSSSSESESSPPQPLATGAKRKRSPAPQTQLPPPLPPSFHDLYASNARTSTFDDPSLHEGRKRAVPHVEGNWAVHVSAEYFPSQTEAEKLQRLVEWVEGHTIWSAPPPGQALKLHSNVVTEGLHVRRMLHISLSGSLHIQTALKEELLKDFSNAITHCFAKPGADSHNHVFSVGFSDIKWSENSDSTRYFLSLTATKPENDELNKLVRACNGVARAWDLPPIYEPHNISVDRGESSGKRSKLKSSAGTSQGKVIGELDHTGKFHMSIGWTLTRPRALIRKTGKFHQIPATIRDEALQMRASFENIKVKIGNIVTPVAMLAPEEKKDIVR